MSVLQNRLVLGFVSFLILGVGTLFVLQPTVAHAEAAVQVQPDRKTGDIVIFGSVTLTNGQPEAGVHIEAATYGNGRWQDQDGDQDWRGGLKPLASATTGSDGRYKLWIEKRDSYGLMHGNHTIVMLVRPDSGKTYQQDILLKNGDIASVTIMMRDPLVPILPFTVFVY